MKYIFKTAGRIKTGIIWTLHLVALILAVSPAGAQSRREKALLDSQIHRCFLTCAKPDPTAFLNLYPKDKILGVFIGSMAPSTVSKTEIDEMMPQFRAAILKGFVEEYGRGVEAGISWGKSSIVEIRYSPEKNKDVSEKLSLLEYKANVLMLDNSSGKQYATTLSCLLIMDTIAMIVDGARISPAPDGLQAWIDRREEDYTSVITTADTSFTVNDTAMVVTPVPAELSGIDPTTATIDTFTGRIGKREIVFTLTLSGESGYANIYNTSIAVFEDLALITAKNDNFILLRRDNDGFWKLYRDGAVLKGRCIYFDRRPDEVVELRQTN